MNLFSRNSGRRKSTTSETDLPELASNFINNKKNGLKSTANGFASLRRAILPRSKTSDFVSSAASNTPDSSGQQRNNPSLKSDWSYVGSGRNSRSLKTGNPLLNRSCSLNRDELSGPCRSVTVPNFQQVRPTTFSTFRNQTNKNQNYFTSNTEHDSMESLLTTEDDNNSTATTPYNSSYEVLDNDNLFQPKKSLDSLLDNSSCSSSAEKKTNNKNKSRLLKSNSLPKTAFGSIQLKVQEIRAQLDVLKTVDNAIPVPATPSTDNIQHPNTPAQGYEYMMPPNVIHSNQQQQSKPLYPMQQMVSSNFQVMPGELVNEMSPSSPTNVKKSNSSSSPSTLSPCSSNSLPSTSSTGVTSGTSNNNNNCTTTRPQILKLPQSHSLNCFPSDAADNSTKSELDKLSFFFNVLNTQDKISKVINNILNDILLTN